MRLVSIGAICTVILTSGLTSASAAPPGYRQAEQVFETDYSVEERIRLQILLIAGGHANAVPTEHFSTRVFHALQAFQIANGFPANGRPTGPQIDRLFAETNGLFAQWGFRKVGLPGHAATVWVPFGLGLDVRATAMGLHYRDRAGRFSLALVSLPHVGLRAALDGLVEPKRQAGWAIHYAAIKDGWFAVSATGPDGVDHYYRYHQDGAAITGFAMDWDNALGDVHAERIAVIDSGALAAAMTGAPFTDPPPAAVAEAPPAPAPQQAAVPVAPAPAPPPRQGVSTGTGFFVSEDGHLVTNAHVVKACSAIAVKTDDGAVQAGVVLATDATNDLALLKLAKKPARVAALRIGARLGEGVEAFGFPHSDILSTGGNFTLGNVTALSGMRDDIRYLQISAPVQAGNSGGPLLDGSGALVGVVSAKLDAIKVMLASDDLPQNVNFAVKAAMVAAFLDANRVAYKVAVSGGAALPPADIADQARAMSGFVVCR